MLEIGLLTGGYIYNLKFRRIWMNVELSTSFPFLGAFFGEIPYSIYSIYSKMTWMCWLWLSPHNLSCSWETPFLAPTGPLFAGKMALPHNLSIAEHLKVFIRDQRWAASQAVANPRWRHQPGLVGEIYRFGWGNTFCETIKEWWFPAFPADFDFPGNSWLIASWFSIIYVLINHDFHEPEAQEVSPEGCFHTFCCQGSCLRLRLHQGRFGESSGFHQHQLHQLIDIHPSTFMTCLTCPTPQHLAGSSKNLRQKNTEVKKKNEVSNNAPLFLGISFRTSTRSGRPHQRGTASRAAARHRPAPPLPVPPRTEPPPPEAWCRGRNGWILLGKSWGLNWLNYENMEKIGEDWCFPSLKGSNC